jgi:hypothetical protein
MKEWERKPEISKRSKMLVICCLILLFVCAKQCSNAVTYSDEISAIESDHTELRDSIDALRERMHRLDKILVSIQKKPTQAEPMVFLKKHKPAVVIDTARAVVTDTLKIE